MKKLIFILFNIFFLIQFFYSQEGWVHQNPVPQGGTINDITFPSSTIGYISAGTALNDVGVIMKTTNGGNNWSLITQGTGLGRYPITFFNTSTGVTGAGSNTKIARTTDGGYTWSYQTFAVYDYILSIQKIDSSTACIGTYNGNFYVTTNTGINWSLISYTSFGFIVRDWYFVTTNTAFVIAGSKILKTTNGGLNWTQQYSDSSSNFLSITFKNNNTGIVTGYNGKIRRTTNSGILWDSIYSGTNVSLNSVSFIDNTTVIITGSSFIPNNSVILHSTNAGINWIVQDSNCKDDLLAVCSPSSNIVYVGGLHGRILKSINNGNNWTSVAGGFPNSMGDLCFFNSNTGYAIGGSTTPGSYSTFIKTTNGGINWSVVNMPTGYTLKGMSFLDANTGAVVGDISTIYRTTNGGLNWINQSIAGSLYLEDVYFINSATGFIVANTKVFKTTSSGSSWSEQTITPDAKKISFPSNQVGYIACAWSNNNIMKTTNTGENWVVNASLPTGFTDIFFINENTGWAAGGKIYKTTNGGMSWIQVYTSSGGAIYFINSNTGYVLAGNGIILYTNDGGNNWYQQLAFTGDILSSVKFVNDTTGWIVGYNGVILHTTNGGILSNIENSNTKVINAFNISQNYPNPFNPNTNINFQISKTSDVKLIIYDILGREVSVLVNEQLKAGTYETEWDGTNYSSGVYFYKLITSGYTETRKMVLVK